MDYATYEDCPVDQIDWLKKRKTGIGGSDAAAVCGISPYRSPMEVWMDKTDRLPPQEENELFYWGHTLEPVIRDEFVRRTGLTVYTIDKILRHTEFPFMLANLDGIVVDPVRGNCIFEAKTVSAFKAAQWHNGIPDDYMLQLQHYMAVTGYSGAYIASLTGGNEFAWQFIERDDMLISMLIDLESAFWEYVVTDTQPPMDGSDASSRLLAQLYPTVENKSSLALPDHALAIIQDYETAKAREKAYGVQKQLAENQLKELLEAHETGLLNGYTVKWSNVSANRFDSDTFRKEHSDLFLQYQKPSQSRRFSLKGGTEHE